VIFVDKEGEMDGTILLNRDDRTRINQDREVAKEKKEVDVGEFFKELDQVVQDGLDKADEESFLSIRTSLTVTD
jgi:hypothetical protein